MGSGANAGRLLVAFVVRFPGLGAMTRAGQGGRGRYPLQQRSGAKLGPAQVRSGQAESQIAFRGRGFFPDRAPVAGVRTLSPIGGLPELDGLTRRFGTLTALDDLYGPVRPSGSGEDDLAACRFLVELADADDLLDLGDEVVQRESEHVDRCLAGVEADA
jgi:hypothetical protein